MISLPKGYKYAWIYPDGISDKDGLKQDKIIQNIIKSAGGYLDAQVIAVRDYALENQSNKAAIFQCIQHLEGFVLGVRRGRYSEEPESLNDAYKQVIAIWEDNQMGAELTYAKPFR